MGRDEWLLVCVLVMVTALLIVNVLNYHEARRQKQRDRVLLRELRNFPRRIPPDMQSLSDEELFL